MSGGVDSGMTASILKDQEYDVVGVFMRLNDSSKTSETKARNIAKKLGIPFSVVDLRNEFNKRIINYFLEELKRGNTPNPCVFCNEQIKFGLLFDNFDSDFFATGHYVKIKDGHIFKAKDPKKDQTYFLWRLKNKQLQKALFPMGDLIKENVKKEAFKKEFPIFPYVESQEICFIPGKTEDYLKKKLKTKKGNIIDEKGKVLGVHNGLWFYTIGQRKGIGFSGGPYFVIAKDNKKNVLIVSKNEKLLLKKTIQLKDVNWINKVKIPIKVSAKIRSGQKEVLGKVYKKGSKYYLEFNKPVKAVTPGQSAVFYKGKELLGGGIII